MYSPHAESFSWTKRPRSNVSHLDSPDATSLTPWHESSGGTLNGNQTKLVTDAARRISNLSGYYNIFRVSAYCNSDYGHDNEHEDVPTNPFELSDENPELNPNSGIFDAEAWARNFLQLRSRDPERYPRRTAGVSFRHLSVFGSKGATDYQSTLSNIWLKASSHIRGLLSQRKPAKVPILRDFEGLVESGEMLLVLGRPGSGCSTFLRTLAGQTEGLQLQEISDIQYQGISYDEMKREFRGEINYQADKDVHFPELTAGQTLLFAALARTPANRLPGVSREQYALHMRDVVMAILNLTHTVDTKVGNEYIRGVSGGERKRVSIAETMLCNSTISCWDNSTQGLDSSSALDFAKYLKTSTRYTGSTALVAIYQAGQAIYDLFDKVILLYEGREIFFGPTHEARSYFVDIGFECPERQTTSDFLTSLTCPDQRRVQPGYESSVPRTADEFAERWQNSWTRMALLKEISSYQARFPLGGDQLRQFQRSREMEKSHHGSKRSPFIASFPYQVRLCLWRAALRFRADFAASVIQVFSSIITSLITASIFYGLADNTSTLFPRGTLLFATILMTTLNCAMKVLSVWEQRPIVEKHKGYALYRPAAEALSDIIIDLPVRFITSGGFCLCLYFLTDLRQGLGHFLLYYIITILSMLSMSNLFRCLSAFSRTLDQAMLLSALMLLAVFTYTGFVIPIPDMRPWFRWIAYINPIAYTFQALMINEFSDRHLACALYIPFGSAYSNLGPKSVICNANGAVAGQNYVDGDTYIQKTYEYSPDALARNIIILVAFFFITLVAYILASELISFNALKPQVLVFPRCQALTFAKRLDQTDEEQPHYGDSVLVRKDDGHSRDRSPLQSPRAIFHWQDVCYDVKIKNGTRRILDSVDGWVVPGTLTALMGSSGAGKTTLLDVLADRVTVGAVTGEVLVNGRPRDSIFQRSIGYVQQQDLHFPKNTVREAMIFSALLRQPTSVPRAEKIAYVDEIIEVLDMEDYANAVIGELGEGLNLEQRKRLTIGVEMAAKPELLLFFDEPTSGLDSQSALSICKLMRKLADHGQAILCTIHQPSATLMQEFDKLLLLARGGRTVYFGPLGHQMGSLIQYFEKNGAPPCPPTANPAEWMLDTIGTSDIDWADLWHNSPERRAVHQELTMMKEKLPRSSREVSRTCSGEFATSFIFQLIVCLERVFEEYWRNPNYIYTKLLLGTLPALFIGFSFWHEKTSMRGLSDQAFSIFMIMSIMSILVLQSMPQFIFHRKVYENRESLSRIYSWKVFMLSSILVELPYNMLLAFLMFLSYYYPVALYRNAEATNDVTLRSGIMLLLFQFLTVFATTFSIMVTTMFDSLETAGSLASPLLSVSLVFCGILRPKISLPKPWIPMYRVSPFTYFASTMLSTALSGNKVHCSAVELLRLDPPSGQTCGEFLGPYMYTAGGTLINPNATSGCQFCQLRTTDEFLKVLNMDFSDYPRNLGILCIYVCFNIVMAMLLYWVTRVFRKQRQRTTKRTSASNDGPEKCISKNCTEGRSAGAALTLSEVDEWLDTDGAGADSR